MIYSIKSKFDTTIYEKLKDGIYSSSVNTGIDEVLELEKVVSSSLGTGPFNSRILIKFDIPKTVESSSQEIKPKGAVTSYLNLYSAAPENSVAKATTLHASPISQSWSPGLGRKSNRPYTTDGSSWKHAHGIAYPTWSNHNGTPAPGASITTGPSLNITDARITMPTHSYQRFDLRLDVSHIVESWTGSVIPNHGFVINRRTTHETGGDRHTHLQFYSKDTHTIYEPRLEFCWDDSTWNTGSLTELDTSDGSSFFIYTKNNNATYEYGTKAKFRIVGREKYPVKTYGTTSTELAVKYIPSGSAFYSVKDLKTGETIIPYDHTFTKISCDSVSNFFEIYTTNLSAERYYQLEIKVYESGSGLHTPIGYYPIKDVFKVVR